jgi:hypothetical protein
MLDGGCSGPQYLLAVEVLEVYAVGRQVLLTALGVAPLQEE